MNTRITSVLLTSLLLTLNSVMFAQSTNSCDTGKHPRLGILQALLGGEQYMAHHPKLAKAWKFLHNENFRAELEAPMTSSDRQAVEAAVVDIKSNFKILREMKPQFAAAHEAHDRETVYKLIQTVRPNLDQIRSDRRTILDLLAKYKFSKNTSTSSFADPVYPNPVRVGGGPATVTYRLKASGPVKITISDASGNIVQEISNSMESEGEHSISVGPAITRPGSYYVTIEADGAKSSQKIAVTE